MPLWHTRHSFRVFAAKNGSCCHLFFLILFTQATMMLNATEKGKNNLLFGMTEGNQISDRFLNKSSFSSHFSLGLSWPTWPLSPCSKPGNGLDHLLAIPWSFILPCQNSRTSGRELLPWICFPGETSGVSPGHFQPLVHPLLSVLVGLKAWVIASAFCAAFKSWMRVIFLKTYISISLSSCPTWFLNFFFFFLICNWLFHMKGITEHLRL